MLRHLPHIDQSPSASEGTVPWGPWALVQFWWLQACGFNPIIETQTFPSQLVKVCLAQWNEVYVGYSTEVGIILRVWWRAYSLTNHILRPLICYRTMHNEWRGERDGFGSDLSPFTSTLACECVPVLASCSRILHAANVASAGNCPSLFFSISHQPLSLFIYLFHWLAGSLFINLMQFAHIHSTPCFSSPGV